LRTLTSRLIVVVQRGGCLLCWQVAASSRSGSGGRVRAQRLLLLQTAVRPLSEEAADPLAFTECARVRTTCWKRLQVVPAAGGYRLSDRTTVSQPSASLSRR
jgi:hypothetical protein